MRIKEQTVFKTDKDQVRPTPIISLSISFEDIFDLVYFVVSTKVFSCIEMIFNYRM